MEGLSQYTILSIYRWPEKGFNFVEKKGALCYYRHRNRGFNSKLTEGGDKMNGAAIIKNAMDEFKDIQEYMALARKENAVETYAKLKDKYLLLKALLTSLGVNLTDIDKMKE